jgi:hypothetical protein
LKLVETVRSCRNTTARDAGAVCGLEEYEVSRLKARPSQAVERHPLTGAFLQRGAKGDHRRLQIRRAVGSFPEFVVDQTSNGVILGPEASVFASLARINSGEALR